jgi:hypothetical protein
MGYSKRQFIKAALAEIGLAEYAFDISPQQEEAALQRLDSMMAEWNAMGIRIGYPLPSSPDYSNVEAETGVPDSAYEAISTNLALKLAPQYGRQVMAATARSAAQSLNTLHVRFMKLPKMRYAPNTPLGAGNRQWSQMRGQFVIDQLQPVDAGPDQEIEY